MSEELNYNKEDLKNNYNVHDHLKDLSVEELKIINSQDRLPYAVGTFNVNGDLNIGIICRTAILMGAERLLVFGKRHFNRRSCVGAYHYLPIDNVGGLDHDTQVFNYDLYWETINKYNYFPVYVEMHEKSQLLNIQEDLITKIMRIYNKKPCFIFGSESHGIPNNLLDIAEEVYYLPMKGVIRSLNVSSTASMVMWTIMNNYN